MTESDDLIREFLIESHEGLDRLDQALVDLEKAPRDRDTLASVFRTVHTIKGTCGFLGFTKLEAVSHVGESLLSRLRDGELILDAAITTALLEMVDAIREILGCIETTGGEGDADYTAVVVGLQQLDQRDDTADRDPVAMPPGESDVLGVCDRRQGVSNRTLRVDVGLVDTLMDVVGELVLARNQILQLTSTQNDASLAEAAQRLDLITSELHEGVMKIRLQRIGHVWSRLPRVVRHLAATCGKQVRIEMEGKDTELDRTIVEAIRDALTHIIRNAVDHGIEPPADRLARGKRPEGTIRLRAFHEGGQVNIEVSDDGAGIAVARVRQRALARGLVTVEQAQRLDDHDAIKLIVLPGFSTAERITHVSGRGVGLDVVRTNIEKIGGTIDIRSVPGRGTTLRMKIPLPPAIIPAVMDSSGGERFAIPQVSLPEPGPGARSRRSRDCAGGGEGAPRRSAAQPAGARG